MKRTSGTWLWVILAIVIAWFLVTFAFRIVWFLWKLVIIAVVAVVVYVALQVSVRRRD